MLIRAAASSVNGADIDVRAGHLRAISGRRFPKGAGFDFTGEVAAVADDVADFRVGEGVWGFVNNLKATPTATGAEYVLAPARAIFRRPNGLDAVEAAALPGAAGAALATLQKIGVLAGERVLIRGGAGGVGSAAVQLAAATGAQVVALARGVHLDRIRELGALQAYDYTTTDPKELGEFDVIVDPVGKDLHAYRGLLRRGGRPPIARGRRRLRQARDSRFLTLCAVEPNWSTRRVGTERSKHCSCMAGRTVVGADVVQHHVQGCFDRAGVAVELGQEQSAL